METATNDEVEEALLRYARKAKRWHGKATEKVAVALNSGRNVLVVDVDGLFEAQAMMELAREIERGLEGGSAPRPLLKYLREYAFQCAGRFDFSRSLTGRGEDDERRRVGIRFIEEMEDLG